MTRFWTPNEMPDQSGRTALVTGANSGLGFHTALELARHGARVLLACRDAQRGADALDRLRTEVPDAAAELVSLDLGSLASVHEAARDVAGRVERLDTLVANAGVMATPHQRTTDGFELQLGTNHLGHFALVGRLLPQLLASPAPRVVSVSSFAHKIGAMHWADPQLEKGYGRWRAYGQSKLANLLFTGELDRRASETALVAAAAHPGFAATHLGAAHGNPLFSALMAVSNRTIAQSDAHGAWPQLYAATMPDVQGDDYFGPASLEVRGHPVRVGRTLRARNPADAQRLWELSEELTGVSYDLPA